MTNKTNKTNTIEVHLQVPREQAEWGYRASNGEHEVEHHLITVIVDLDDPANLKVVSLEFDEVTRCHGLSVEQQARAVELARTEHRRRVAAARRLAAAQERAGDVEMIIVTGKDRPYIQWAVECEARDNDLVIASRCMWHSSVWAGRLQDEWRGYTAGSLVVSIQRPGGQGWSAQANGELPTGARLLIAAPRT